MAELETSILLQLKDSITAPLQKVRGAFNEMWQAAGGGHNGGGAFSVGMALNQAGEAAEKISRKLERLTDEPKELARSTEVAFAQLRYRSGLTGEAFEDLKKKVEGVAAGTKFGYRDLADGAVVLTESGTTAEQTITRLQLATKLASVGQMDLHHAIGMTTDLMKGYAAPAEDAAKYTEMLVHAAKVGGVASVEQLGSALAHSSVSAHQLGVSVEQTAGLTAALTKTLGPEQVGRAGEIVSGMMSHLMQGGRGRSGGQAGMALEWLYGGDKTKIKEQMRDLPALLADATAKLPQLEKQKQGVFFRYLFGSPELADLMTKLGPEGLRKTIAEMADYDGALKRAAVATDTAQAAHNKMLGSVERLKDAIGEKLLPGAKHWDEMLAGIIEKVHVWVDAHPHLIEDLMRLANSVKVVAEVLATVLPVVATIAGAKGLVAMAGAATSLTTALGPLGLMLTGIALAMVQIKEHSAELKEAFTTWGGLKSVGRWISRAGLTEEQQAFEADRDYESAHPKAPAAGGKSAQAAKGAANSKTNVGARLDIFVNDANGRTSTKASTSDENMLLNILHKGYALSPG